MRHISKNAAKLEKFAILEKMWHNWRNAPHKQKCATPDKMRRTWKKARHLKKCGTFGEICHPRKMRHNLRNAPHEEMRHIWRMWHTLKNVAILEKDSKNVAHFVKCAILWKMRNAWKDVPHAPYLKRLCTLGKMLLTLKSAADMEKCSTLGKVHHTSKNTPHLGKCATLGKKCHIFNPNKTV